MNNLYDVLELCLQDMQNGADLETVLARYPDRAEELRPILSAAVHAQKMAVPAPSEDVVRRNRAKLLQRAAQKREFSQTSNKRFSSFQGRWATAFVLFVLVLFSALNVISASALALPGDGLYPVKRWWERVRLSVTVGEEARNTVAGEMENERLREIEQLFSQGISARVDFSGVVTSQHGDAWRIAKLMVFVTDQTELPDGPIQVGVAVRVYGITRGDAVLAERIEYLPVNSALPGISPIFDEMDFTATPTLMATATALPSATATPVFTATPSPSPTATPTIVPGNNNVNSNANDDEASNSNENDNGNGNDNANDSDDNTNDDDSNSNDDNSNDDNSGSGGGGDD